jgi:hypothetical protein
MGPVGGVVGFGGWGQAGWGQSAKRWLRATQPDTQQHQPPRHTDTHLELCVQAGQAALVLVVRELRGSAHTATSAPCVAQQHCCRRLAQLSSGPSHIAPHCSRRCPGQPRVTRC